jgi:hypothetical protein
MASQVRTYALPDPTAIVAKVKAAGGPAIDATQPTGHASADGVTLGWKISGGEIEITVISKPWVVPYGTIWSHVDAVLG